MRCTAEVAAFDRRDDLPAEALALLADPASGLDGLFGSADWYRLAVAEAIPHGARPCFLVVSIDGVASVLLPLQVLADGSWQSLTTPYSCLWRPLTRPGLEEAGLVLAGRAVARHCRSGLRLEAMDAGWPGLAGLLKGVRSGGLHALRYAHFGNWHEGLPPEGWAAYLAGRDGALRETIRRKTARAVADPRIEIELFRSLEDIDRGVTAFEDVYARSWKEPEPFPGFNAGFMRAAAGLGLLRLGVMWQDGSAIAAQYWVVTGGTASVLKLAHDEAARRHSPGTVLTAWMIKAMLAGGGITELDFGRGDDPYKQGWASRRRERVGFVLANPLRTAGMAAIARHRLGDLRRALRGSRSGAGKALPG